MQIHKIRQYPKYKCQEFRLSFFRGAVYMSPATGLARLTGLIAWHHTDFLYK